MSNYPNMSYCMCNNTLLALKQVLEAIQEEGPQFLQDLSREEHRAFQELYYACESLCTEVEALEEQAADYDGQPDEAQEWHDFDPDC